jgi:hypothetical protein
VSATRQPRVAQTFLKIDRRERVFPFLVNCRKECYNNQEVIDRSAVPGLTDIEKSEVGA